MQRKSEAERESPCYIMETESERRVEKETEREGNSTGKDEK